jgi:hypothetical protein
MDHEAKATSVALWRIVFFGVIIAIAALGMGAC